MAKKILSVANHFEVEGLKNESESFIIDRISLKNAVDLAIFAESHSCARLLKATVEYMYSHARYLKELQNEDWDRLVDNRCIFDQVVDLLLGITKSSSQGMLEVKNAGNPCINGIYHQDGCFNGAPR